MKKRILVTGGAGFIGKALTTLLLRRGADVTVLDNLSFGRKANLSQGARLIVGDLRSSRFLKRALRRRFDAVFHLAALHFIPYCNAHPEEALSVNVEGTRCLLQHLAVRKPRKFFFASTAAIYDVTSRYHRENDLPAPADIYGISKLAGEHLVREFHATSGVPCVIGRLFNAYGPAETNPHLVPRIVEQLRQGKRILALGNLHPFRDYIHTSDMARAIVRLLDRARRGVFLSNIASGEERSVRQVVATFSRVLGRKLPVRSRAELRRKVERVHLRAHLGVLRRSGFRPEIRFEEGIRDLLREEGLVSS